MVVSPIWAILALTITIPRCNCDIRQVERQLITTLLEPIKYDSRIRAYENDTSYTTIAWTNLFVRSVRAIDDASMDYKVQLTFRMHWSDSRLSYPEETEGYRIPYLTLDPNSDKIWVPDLFFSNELDAHAHKLLTPNTYTRVFPDGTVLFSTRISLTLSCPMDLKLFPFDRPVCSIRMASYKWTTYDLIFKWKPEDPVQVTHDIQLRKFFLKKFNVDNCDSHTATGVYSCLRLDFSFHRELSYYLVHVYIPSTMFVIAAWFSFWISGRQSGIARLLFSLHTLLVLSIAVLVMNTTFPATSYVKAIDVWTGICLTFVFGSVVLGVIVTYINTKEEGEAKEEQNSTSPIKSRSPREIWNQFLRKRTSNKIDTTARILYPVLFLLFNIIYWRVYLTSSKDLQY